MERAQRTSSDSESSVKTEVLRAKPDTHVYRGLMFTGFHMHCIQVAFQLQEERRVAAEQLAMIERALREVDGAADHLPHTSVIAIVSNS